MIFRILAILILGHGLSAASAAERAKPSTVEDELQVSGSDAGGNELKELKAEVLVMRTEKRALAQLQKLIQKYKGTALEPDMYFRLAELHIRRAKTERFFEMNRDSQNIVQFAPQLVRLASERGEILQAIEIYERIQKRFPDYGGMDLVIFNNAFANQQIAREQEAERLYHKVIKEFPDSPLLADAYLSLGEISFKRREYAKALDLFSQIRKFPDSRVYPYGLYKAAWCNYNLQNASGGLKLLEEVVAYGREVAESGKDAKLDLRKEALADMTLFYSDSRKAGDAVAYFLAQAKGLDATLYLLKLVEIYKTHSKYAEIQITLKDTIRVLPDSPVLPRAHDELVWNFDRQKERDGAALALQNFDSYCGSLLASKNPEAADTLKDCQQRIGNSSKRLATRWHATWKSKSADPSFAIAAEKTYEIYLKNALKTEKEYATVHFSFAELLFQRENFRQASEHYFLVTGETQDAALKHKASYAAAFALEKATNDNWNDKDEKRFLELADFYLKNFPNGEQSLDLRFKVAFINYEKDRLDLAAKAFKELGWSKDSKIQAHPKTVKAQDLYLDILNHKKDYTALKQAAQSLLSMNVAKGERAEGIRKIYRDSFFLEIQKLEEQEKLPEAYAAYLQFADENREGELPIKALWNASQVQYRLGDFDAAAQVCDRLTLRYAKAPQSKDCIMQSAQLYESMGRLDSSAKYLTQLAEIDKENAFKWRELAAEFWALEKQWVKAKDAYTKLAADYPKKQEDLWAKIVEVDKESGNIEAYNKTIAKLAKQGVEPYATEKLVAEVEQLLQSGKATEAFAAAMKVMSRDKITPPHLARARLVQAQILEQELASQSVKSRLERMATVLALKTEKLEKAQQAYQSILKYNLPEYSLKAIRGLSRCYLTYVDSLRYMPLPADMTDADKAALKREVDNLTMPIEEKGVESLAQAIEIAHKARLRDGQAAEIQAHLDKLNMRPGYKGAIKIENAVMYVPQVVARKDGGR